MSTKAQATTEPRTQTRSPNLVHVHHSTVSTSINNATATLAEAFEADPVTAWMFNHLAPTSRPAATQKLFRLSGNAALLAGGELWSASTTPPSATSSLDFHAAATIYPPGTSIDSLGATSLPSLLWSGSLVPALSSIGIGRFKSRMDALASATKPAKKIIFANSEEFFYIQTIGASSAHRGKGLAPSLIRKLQERATKEGKPIYLEASNKGAKKVYEKLGFEVVGSEIRLGEGECAEDGEKEEGENAVGVPIWAMVWWPEAKTV